MKFFDKNKKGGRPAFKPTQRMRNQVEIAAAAGLAHSDIATALHISRPTLLDNFADELKNGRVRRLLKSLCALDRAQQRGSVAAAKYLVNVFYNGAPVRLGKKEAKLAAARAVADDPSSPWYGLIGRANFEPPASCSDEPAARNGQLRED